jgi:hypothetical protein
MRLQLFGAAMVFEELNNSRNISVVFVSGKQRTKADWIPILE